MPGPPVFFRTIWCGEGKLLFIVCKVLGREGYQIFNDCGVCFRDVVVPRAIRAILELTGDTVRNNTI